MKWKNFKSNDIRGTNFILDTISAERKWQKARDLFTSFIETNGFDAWHIHDGWVMCKHKSGEVLKNEILNITWITQHAGFSHTPKCPAIGKKMVIVKNSPDGDESTPFDLYCYEVIAKSNKFNYEEIEIKLIEIKQALFNKEENKYQLYSNERWNIFSPFRDNVKSKNKIVTYSGLKR